MMCMEMLLPQTPYSPLAGESLKQSGRGDPKSKAEPNPFADSVGGQATQESPHPIVQYDWAPPQWGSRECAA